MKFLHSYHIRVLKTFACKSQKIRHSFVSSFFSFSLFLLFSSENHRLFFLFKYVHLSKYVPKYTPIIESNIPSGGSVGNSKALTDTPSHRSTYPVPRGRGSGGGGLLSTTYPQLAIVY